jgi:FixJ family two-component response regulator
MQQLKTPPDLKPGVVDFIAKPVDKDALIAKIEKVLQSKC